MQFIKKYLLLLMLLENVAIKSGIIGHYLNYFFYIFIAFGILLFFSNVFFSKDSYKKNKWIYFLIVIYTFYEFIIGIEFLDKDTLQYYFARISSFAIISVGITQNYTFYETKSPRIFYWEIGFILLLGTITGDLSSGGRLTAGYSNANSAAGAAAILLAFVLFDENLKKWNVKKILLVIFGLYVLIFSGSRAALLTVLIISFIRYKVKFGYVLFVACLFFATVFILPNYNIHFTAIERSIGTIQGEVKYDRDEPREATIMMIKERPMIGWGLGSKIQGPASAISEFGSHNGYLDTTRFMGVPLAIIYFIIIVTVIIRHYYILRKHKKDPDAFFAIAVSFMFMSMYEGLFTGVHEVETNMFFFALAMISTKSYMLENNIQMYMQNNQ